MKTVSKSHITYLIIICFKNFIALGLHCVFAIFWSLAYYARLFSPDLWHFVGDKDVRVGKVFREQGNEDP